MENNLMPSEQNNFMANFEKTDDILKDMCGIIESSRDAAYKAVNMALIQRNWLIGYRIAEEELKGEERAEYGASVIKNLSKNCRRFMERDLQKRIYIAFIPFINASPKFSTQ